MKEPNSFVKYAYQRHRFGIQIENAGIMKHAPITYNCMHISFLSLSSTLLRKTSFALQLTLVFILFAACSKDDADDSSADMRQIVGVYTVQDTDEWDEVETYSISISQSSQGGSNIEITNFGDIMYVPVKALFKGSTLTLPAQTYAGKTVTITISGHGELDNNVLKFDYTVETNDDYVFDHSCLATR